MPPSSSHRAASKLLRMGQKVMKYSTDCALFLLSDLYKYSSWPALGSKQGGAGASLDPSMIVIVKVSHASAAKV